ncbi:MAG: DEAD/DEAH box helicase [Desulfotalea sp.]
MTTLSFADYDLRPNLLKNIKELGFETPTPIQNQTIPILLAGSDLVGQAQTGTGKTAAFGLPLLNSVDHNKKHVQALVLAPTRELAQQVGDAIMSYAGDKGKKVLVVYGGSPYQKQLSGLKNGAQVVVGTPGRLIDLMKRGALKLDQLQTLVLDEADEMLSMGFIDDIEEVMSQAPESKQTMLFSATLSPRVMSIARKYLKNPKSISVTPEQMIGSTIEQRYYLVNRADKIAAITRLFEVEEIESALIFSRTRQATADLANELISRGFSAEALSGDLSQEARTRVLSRFKKGQVKVLVATDVAARGLDIDDISHVFNFDPPEDPEVYVHRIGRTGRAGRSGCAISLMTPKDRWMQSRIEKYTGKKLIKSELPTQDEIMKHRDDSLHTRLEVWIKRGRCRSEREIIERLVEGGHDPIDVAAAALKIIRKDENKRSIEPVKAVVAEPSKFARRRNDGRKGDRKRPMRGGRTGQRDFADNSSSKTSASRDDSNMVTLSLNAGRKDGVGVNHIVASLSHFAGISSRELGKISVSEAHSSIDVPNSLVSKMLSHNDSYRIAQKPVNLTK